MAPSLPISALYQIVEAKTGVPRRQQRLIAAGGHVGGDTVGGALKDGAVVHLFPLPNILTEDEYEASQQEARAAGDPAAAGAAAGQAAHVPRILVADEQAAFELHRNMNDGEGVFAPNRDNQRRVKMFAALLILVSAMQLLTLLTIVAGVQTTPSEQQQQSSSLDPADQVSRDPASSYTVRTWRNSDFADLGLSLAGFWVGTTGLKASQNEDTATAKRAFSYQRDLTDRDMREEEAARRRREAVEGHEQEGREMLEREEARRAQERVHGRAPRPSGTVVDIESGTFL
ncbi:hypothetical protein TeGR_g3523 [Tetraparma gracilis]|uniref:Ubiquitin-like domain-containing protein n=1 Tax=Tetraparma gracilis TaxID=2962635 RepID=A0ABQ6MDD3_9STRA|nr:hypothetical protein TeGR_g3523 [Tetraparma gracilis]